MNTKVDSAIKTIAVVAMFSAALFYSSPAAGITLVGTFNGTTRYVSKSGSNSNGGTSWDDAKLTIQDAVNLCADGDTVIVDDGEYSDTTAWTSSNDATYKIPTVVQIGKSIHLVSRNGKFKTHIVGQWANTSTGVANDGTAHRCIFIGASVGNVLIEGFTIRNGSVAATTAGNKDYDCGGGVYGNTGSGSTYVLDCDIVNCRAGTGAAAARKVVPIRCAFVGNCGVNSSYTTQHVFYRTSYAYDCVIAMNGPATRAGSIFSSVQGTKVANCTFIDNTCNGFAVNDTDPSRTHRVWNCAFLGVNEVAGSSSQEKAASANMYFTNCVQTATGGRIAEQGAAAGDVASISEYQHFYAADSDKWKFLSGGNLKDAGLDSARTIAAAGVPEEYLDYDFFGNPRKVGDHIDIGAVEAQGDAVDAPASGYIRLGTNVAVRAGEKIVSLPRGLVAIESDMAQARLVPAIGPATPFFGFVVSGAWDLFCRFPDRGDDRGAWMTPPASGELVTVNIKTATAEKWVDASYAGGDSDGSKSKPYTTIQDAVDHTAAYGLIHVAEGIYGTGGVTLTDHPVISRVGIDNHIAVRASGDPAATIIKGGENTRCVAVRRTACVVHVQGFTLKDGIADASTAPAGGLGGGFYVTPQDWSATGLSLGNLRNAQVTDCIFIGNSARQGSAISGGWAQRCLFYGNAATATNRGSGNDYTRGAVALNTVLSACVSLANPQTRSDTICSFYHCQPYNVTFAETNYMANSTSNRYRPVDQNTPSYNCVFKGGFVDQNTPGGTIATAGAVGDSTLESSATWISRYDSGELFLNPGSDDFHLRAGTDASTKGSAAATNAAMFAVGDFEGNALAYVNGNPVPGAYSTIIDGRDIYADAVNGDDANDGFSADSAKKTIGAALALAYAGDVVHAAPGDYNDGSETYAGGTVISAPQGGTHSPSRGVVKKGVTLVSDEGPDVTFISGVVGNAGNGLGDNAVRCLTALAGSTVRGFTLRNGATFNTSGAVRDENIGGLALSPSCRHGETGSAVFENCVLSNGWGRTAGCIAGGILRHCRVFDGHSTSGATLSMYSRFENCLLVNGASNNTGVRNCGGMLSTTFINEVGGGGTSDNSELNGSLYEYGASYENSILATANKSAEAAVTLKNVTNCLWVTGGGNAKIDPDTSANVITVAKVSDALAMLDGDYRPLAGTSLVDAGDRALLAHLAGDATTDLGGGQRIYGGQVDIGAYEYDMRGDFGAALGRHVEVGSASSDAVVRDGAVRLPSGEISAVLSVANETSFVLPVEVTGSGVLYVYAGNGAEPIVTVRAGDGEVRRRIDAASGGTDLRFVYEPGENDEGYAVIRRFVNMSGAVLIIL